METISEFIKNIENNPLIVTLLGGGIIFTLFRYIGDIFYYLKNIILSIISFEINGVYTIDYNEPYDLKKISYLIDKKSKILWNKKYQIAKVNTFDDSENARMLAVMHGFSIRLLFGKIIFVNRNFNTESQKLQINLCIRIFFANKKKFLKRFLDELGTIKVKENTNNIDIDIVEYYDIEKPKRKIDSIYTNDDLHKKILDDVKDFLNNKEIYEECDVPYKRNYLFYGKPGTGKTSTALAIASELDWSITVVDIHKTRMEVLIRQLSKKNTIFLFEDIDAMDKKSGKNRNNKDEDSPHILEYEDSGELSLGQILNITDGLMSPLGCICIFTTNHIEVLDEAFLRDGRMDFKAEFDNFKAETTLKMLKDKLPTVSYLPLEYIKDDISPATLQEKILRVLLGNMKEDELIKDIYRTTK